MCVFLQLIKHYEAQTQHHRCALSSMVVNRSLTLRESVTYENETSTEQERFRDTLLCIRKWRRVHTLFLLGRIFITTYEVEESDSVRVVHVGILGFEIPVKLWSCEVVKWLTSEQSWGDGGGRGCFSFDVAVFLRVSVVKIDWMLYFDIHV